MMKEEYTCDECSKTYFCKSGLIDHKRVIHSEQTFKCDHCDKTYSRMSVLKKHIRIVHLNQKVSCDVCDKTFINKAKLKLHVFFRCDQCPYAFYTNSHLTRHMEIHKKAKHKCPECGCGFTTKTRMTSHVKTFHPEKAVTIPCHICNKTYSDKYLLQLHVKKVHECREEDKGSHQTRHMAQVHERRDEDKKYR